MLCPCVQGMLFLSWSKTDNSCPFLPWPQKAPLECHLHCSRIWNVLSGSQTVNDAFGTLSTIRCLLTCMSVELLLTTAVSVCPQEGLAYLQGLGPGSQSSRGGCSILCFQAQRTERPGEPLGLSSLGYLSARSWCGIWRNVKGPAQGRACNEAEATCYVCCFNALWYWDEPTGCMQGKERALGRI